jgi:hypothetical protein
MSEFNEDFIYDIVRKLYVAFDGNIENILFYARFSYWCCMVKCADIDSAIEIIIKAEKDPMYLRRYGLSRFNDVNFKEKACNLPESMVWYIVGKVSGELNKY